MRWAPNHSLVLGFHDPPGEEDPCFSPGEGIGVAESGAHQTQVRMSSSCPQFPRQHQSRKELLSSQKKLAALTHQTQGNVVLDQPCSYELSGTNNFHPDLSLRNTTEGNVLYHVMNFTMEFL